MSEGVEFERSRLWVGMVHGLPLLYIFCWVGGLRDAWWIHGGYPRYDERRGRTYIDSSMED